MKMQETKGMKPTSSTGKTIPTSAKSGNHTTREEIANRAYYLYLERKGTPGHDMDDWLRAERELTGKKL